MTEMEAFFALQESLPRQGPGDCASLDAALAPLDLAADARILDAGCGVGADIPGLLAHAPKGHITAVDPHAPFIERARVAHAGDARITAEARSMLDCAGPYDLIWCAGALYFLGLEAGLAWAASALNSDGALAFSEPAYFSEAPSPQARAFWEGEGAAISIEADIRGACEAAGFRVLRAFKLPDAAWEAYYGPMESRVAALRPDATQAMASALDAALDEASRWRAVQAETGYLMVTAEKCKM
ncbi:MAG: class I SAM-dependent methyltransferase [Pseudomonadota bacterium]